MKILLIGKTGQLGGDILRNCGEEHEIYAPARDVLDIERAETIERELSFFRPEVVVNTAAFHNVLQCEVQPGKAFLVNCVAVRDLAQACRRTGSLFVTFSTDYVFDGGKSTPYTEDAVPKPLQVYGISKLAGEYAASAVWPEGSFIIRTCGLYGVFGARSKGGNFVDKRLLDARQPDPLQIGADQTVCPTYTDDLSRSVLSLIGQASAKPGTYHLVNEGQCTWYEFTKAIFEISSIDKRVSPVDRKGRDGNMRRPLYSVLGNNKAKALGIFLPHWKDALSRYIGDKYGLPDEGLRDVR
jgi:dTDP-4-dehydrorhamnose reductase